MRTDHGIPAEDRGRSERPLNVVDDSATQSARRVASPGELPRRIAVAVDPARLRRFHLQLVERLARDVGATVALVRGRARETLPGSVDLLLRLERLREWKRGPWGSDRAEDGNRRDDQSIAGDPPDLLIDFCGLTSTGAKRTIRVLYDGSTDEAALFGALLAGRMPVIEIEDAGHVLARGVPSAENAGTVLGALENVFPRIADLLVSALTGWTKLSALPAQAARSSSVRDVVAFETRALAHSLARRLYHLCCYAPHWRTCWRFVDGADLWQSGSLAGARFDVIPDPGHRFYADPFPVVHGGRSYVFVEDLDHRTMRGRISVVPFDENGPAGPAEPVLEEPWHLSYPFVFAHDGEIWMIPESSERRAVILYRAAPFPRRWVREAILLDGVDASDATIARSGGRFWMFATVREGAGSWSDKLFLYSARDLRGPWQAHPGNPVVVDQATARPAGALLHRNGKLWRPVQDCSAGYGTGIGLVEVVRLDDEAYEQRRHALLTPDPTWPGRRFHTLNRAGRLEVIDGSAHSPRSRLIAGRLERWSGRREFREAVTPVRSRSVVGRA